MTLFALLLTGLSVFLLTTSFYALAWIPAGGAAALVLLRSRPVIAFYLLVLMFPFAAIRDIGGIKVHWLISFALLFLMVLQLYGDRRSIARLGTHLWSAIAVFVLVNVLAALFSAYPSTAWGSVNDLVLACIFIAITLFFVDDEEKLQFLSWVVVASIAIGAFFAVLESFWGIDFFGVEDGDGGGDFNQGKGLTLSHNALSFMIVVAMPLAVHNVLHARTGVVKMVGAAILFVVILGMFATYSRGGFLLTVLAFVLMALQNWRHITKLHIGLFLLMSVSVPIVLVATAPDEYFAHQMTLYSGDTSSIDRRITYLQVAQDAFVESPLIGHGPNAFRDLYSQSEQAREFVKEDQSSRRAAHNTFVDVAIGSGILGLFAFLALLATAFGHFNRAVRIARESGGRSLESLFASYRLSLFLLCTYMLIKSVLDNKYLWLLLAVSVLALRVAKTVQQQEEGQADAHV